MSPPKGFSSGVADREITTSSQKIAHNQRASNLLRASMCSYCHRYDQNENVHSDGSICEPLNFCKVLT
jgi:hypothetical protein